MATTPSPSVQLRWQQVATKGEAPWPRYGHTATVVPHAAPSKDRADVFVFGGTNGEQLFNDLYKLDSMNCHFPLG